MRFVRFCLGFALSLFAFLFIIAGAMPIDSVSASRSLANRQIILSDLMRMGEFTEQIRAETGEIATTGELLSWVSANEFESAVFDGYKDQADNLISLAVVPTGDEFVVGEESGLPHGDGHTYRIAYWDDVTEEYAPETGAHTLPTSVDDYEPELWQRALIILLGIGLGVLALRVLTSLSRDWSPT